MLIAYVMFPVRESIKNRIERPGKLVSMRRSGLAEGWLDLPSQDFSR